MFGLKKADHLAQTIKALKNGSEYIDEKEDNDDDTGDGDINADAWVDLQRE